MSDTPGCPAPEAHRHESLDALRGLLMVAVIIGHFPTSGGGLNPFGPLPQWLYFFHIPLFLALSCLFVRPFTLRQQGLRARQILVPYLFWCVLLHPLASLGHPVSFLRDAAMGNWAHLQSVLWFLPALFTTNLLLALWRRARAGGGRSQILVDLGVGVLAGGVIVNASRLATWHDRIPFGLDVALFLLPFLWGIVQLWARRNLWAKAGAWLVPAALLALPLGGFAVAACEQVKTHSAFARKVDFAQFSVPVTWPGYLGMFLMAASLLVLASRLPWQRRLATLGRNSMPIYLLHYPLLHALTRTIGVAGETRGWLLLYGLAVTALVLGLGLAIAKTLAGKSQGFTLAGF